VGRRGCSCKYYVCSVLICIEYVVMNGTVTANRNEVHEADYFLRYSSSAGQTISPPPPHVTEREGSLPCPQEHSSCPCREPDQSCLRHSNQLFKSYFLIIPSELSLLCFGLSSGFPFVKLPSQNPICTVLPHTCRIPRPSNTY
jgi:hypothetical protein